MFVLPDNHALPSVEVKSIATLRKNSGHHHHHHNSSHHNPHHHHHHHHSPRKAQEKQRHQGIVTWIVNLNELQDRYKIDKKLGDGNYAVVREAIQTGTMKEYAAKIVEKAKLDARDRQMISEEIRIQRACNHPNLVRLYEVYETASDIYMIMEPLKSGDLFDDIKQKIKFSEKQTAVVVNDLSIALFYLHSRNICHRDVKPENVMLVRTPKGFFNVKLCDFGLSTEVREPLSMICGTPTYVAPEILEEKGYGVSVDMWALGVIAFVMLSGYPPFRSPERSQEELFEFIKAGEYEYLSPYWDNISDAPRELIDKLLIVNPSHRFSAIDVLCHPWIMKEGGTLPLNQSPTKEQIANHREDLQKRAQEGLGEFQSLLNQTPPYPIPPRQSANLRLHDFSDSYDY